MTTISREEIDHCILTLLKRGDLQKFDAFALAESLLTEVHRSWDTLPETTRVAMLSVAAMLKRHHVSGLMADLKAKRFVARVAGRTK